MAGKESEQKDLELKEILDRKKIAKSQKKKKIMSFCEMQRETALVGRQLEEQKHQQCQPQA